MSLSAVLSADGPSPTPSESPTPRVPSLQDAQESASNAAGWVEENWSTWLAIGLRVLLIVVIAAVLRVVVRRAITKLIDRMSRTGQAVDGTALGGLLVNAERRRQRSQAIGSVLRSVASFLILGTAALMVLGTFQINLAPLLASAGVAGVAIGFGARNLVTDFLSGVFMILEDQYGVGDTIDAGVASGEVIEVGLRVTKLRGDGGEIWYVRNGEVKRIGNLSQGWATANVDVTVRADEDLDGVRATLGEVAEKMGKEEPWNELAVGPDRGARPGLGAAGLDGGARLGQDDARQGPDRGARAALAHQARLRRGRHPHRRRRHGPGRGRGPRPDGRRGGPVRLREHGLPAVGRRVPAAPARHHQVTTRERGGTGRRLPVPPLSRAAP
ncbi:hypothetical protein SGRIM128S_06890 [Streptomyces griseomycini]